MEFIASSVNCPYLSSMLISSICNYYVVEFTIVNALSTKIILTSHKLVVVLFVSSKTSSTTVRMDCQKICDKRGTINGLDSTLQK